MTNRRLIGVVLVVAAAALSACQQSKVNPYTPYPPCVGSGCVYNPGGGANPAPTPFTKGDTQPLYVVSNTVLQDYAGGMPLNNPQSIVINLAVTRDGNGVYLGEVNIRYSDIQSSGTVIHSGHLTNGTDSSHGNNQNILVTSTNSGRPTYRFFFEDQLGAVIVTLTGHGQNSDTATSPYLDGKVYYRNFNSAAPNPLYNSYYAPPYGEFFPQNPYAFCWSGIITAGPYDCRNFNVEPTTTGDKAFPLLGTFTNMIRTLALGQ